MRLSNEDCRNKPVGAVDGKVDQPSLVAEVRKKAIKPP